MKQASPCVSRSFHVNASAALPRFLCRIGVVPAAAILVSLAQAQSTCELKRASLGPNGQTDENSYSPALSNDGRFVAFTSHASNLVNGDNNNQFDIFLLDQQTGVITLESRHNSGALGNRISRSPAISLDGRYIAYDSVATNLVNGDTNNVTDIFLRDTVTHTTSRVSVSSQGVQGNGQSFVPRISESGRRIAFASLASNLVFNDANGDQDIFVRDRDTGLTTRVSVNTAGIQGNSGSGGDGGFPGVAISSDAQVVAFESFATNLFLPDTNMSSDIFVRDLQASTTTRVSVSSSGLQANKDSISPGLSGDGNLVVFASDATNLVSGDTNGVMDVFLHDRLTGTTSRVSIGLTGEANGASYDPMISKSGRFVAFTSEANNLVTADLNSTKDLFLYDLQMNVMRRINVNAAGVETTDNSATLVISPNGQVTAFASVAPNLVNGDTNGYWDVFVGAPGAVTPTIYCVSTPNSLGCLPAVSFAGCSSASATSGFTIGCHNVRNSQTGVLMYSTTGSASLPFQGGTLCLRDPVDLTPAQSSGGMPHPWNLCDGSYSIDFNAFAQGALGGTPQPALSVPGTAVYTQWMAKDPVLLNPTHVSLSNAVSAVVGL
jgi:hypothetical protein